jgi:hypothetical protein
MWAERKGVELEKLSPHQQIGDMKRFQLLAHMANRLRDLSIPIIKMKNKTNRRYFY